MLHHTSVSLRPSKPSLTVAGKILNSIQTLAPKFLHLHHLGQDHTLRNISTLLNPFKGHELDSFFGATPVH
jgi:hypothetical protein